MFVATVNIKQEKTLDKLERSAQLNGQALSHSQGIHGCLSSGERETMYTIYMRYVAMPDTTTILTDVKSAKPLSTEDMSVVFFFVFFFVRQNPTHGENLFVMVTASCIFQMCS